MLGLGPVRLLGLSRAVGEVSSYAELRLGFQKRLGDERELTLVDEGEVWRTSSSVAAAASAQVQETVEEPKNGSKTIFTDYQIHRSTVVRSNSNPIWPTAQSDSNTSQFSIPLEKGAMPKDGMRIILTVRMLEERTAADKMVPGMVQGSDDAMLGEGELDVTDLVLRNEEDGTTAVDVWDSWIELNTRTQQRRNGNGINPKEHQGDETNASPSSGKMRVIVTFEPHGMHPQKGDIVALESFARRPDALASSIQILPPFSPLQVQAVNGEYLLVSFDILMEDISSSKSSNKSNHLKGHVRLHRNTVFVIERTNVIDTAVDLTLKPVDFALSTPVGKNLTHTAQPYLEATGDLLAPAILSGKLLLEAAKVGGGAFAVGLQSATTAIIQSQDPERRRKAVRRTMDN